MLGLPAQGFQGVIRVCVATGHIPGAAVCNRIGKGLTAGFFEGMQHFDGEIEKLVRANVISRAVGLLYATNPGNLQIELSDVPDENSLITR